MEGFPAMFELYLLELQMIIVECEVFPFTKGVDKVCKKITTNLWLLSRIKEYLTIPQRVQFYKTYIQPHIDYCNTVWGGTSQVNLNRILSQRPL